MFSPEMMQAAQKMMQNMKPEDMQRMSQMAANMDPSVMENMMKSMGGNTNGMDTKAMSEQLKNMSPEQMRAQMSQAQNHMSAQKQYVYNGALSLKEDGNTHIKAGRHKEALEVYDRALENLKPHAGDDVQQLRLSLLLNAALCYLKTKQYQRTIDTCNEALNINSKSVKAIFRRGLAKFEIGQFAPALADVKIAAEWSPEDKTVAAEHTRLQRECKEKGVKDEDVQAAEKAVKSAGGSTTSTNTGSQGGGSSSSSASPAGMSEAMEQLTKDPDSLAQAMEAMKNVSPEDLQRMMASAPVPAGMDPAEARSRMEAVTKNPEMVKTAVESLKAMPEEQRRSLLESSRSMAGGAGGDAPPMDLSSMSKAFENPEAMKQMAEMARNVHGGNTEEAEMMKKAADMLSENPDMATHMSNMMKNMPPDQLQKMMEMSANMRKGGGGMDGASGAGPPANSADAMEAMMNDPDMLKCAEDMMKNMSPETLSSMAKASGIDLDEDKARMLGKFMPYMVKLVRCFGHARKAWRNVWSPKGKVVLAVVVVLIALIQHYRTS